MHYMVDMMHVVKQQVSWLFCYFKYYLCQIKKHKKIELHVQYC